MFIKKLNLQLFGYCGQCEVVNEDCGTCESCQTTCENNCQTTCEAVCQYSWQSCDDCEIACMSCESCQSGEGLTQLDTPTLDTNATIKTSTSITITINTVEGATTYHARINGDDQQSSTSKTFTFTGLTPNTQYYIEIKCSGAGYAESDWNGYYATTLASEPWEWMYSKTGLDLRPHVDEWIAFCNKINEVRVANGLSQYSFSLSSEYIGADKDFYAWIWLQAANAINQINGQVNSACLNVKPYSISQGNDNIIYPWYYENLKTALNNAIV